MIPTGKPTPTTTPMMMGMKLEPELEEDGIEVVAVRVNVCVHTYV